MHHLVERRRDQTAQADQVRLFRFGPFEDLLAGDHDSHVDHLIVVAGQHHADNVLTNIVNVTLDRGQHDLPLRLDHLAGRNHRRLFGLHERRQVRHRFLHYPGGLHHLRQEHLSSAEQITHHAHAVHQGPLDHQQRTAQFEASLLSIDFDVGVNALHQCVRKALIHRTIAPFFSLLFIHHRAGAGSLQRFAMLHQALGGVRPAVE